MEGRPEQTGPRGWSDTAQKGGLVWERAQLCVLRKWNAGGEGVGRGPGAA